MKKYFLNKFKIENIITEKVFNIMKDIVKRESKTFNMMILENTKEIFMNDEHDQWIKENGIMCAIDRFVISKHDRGFMITSSRSIVNLYISDGLFLNDYHEFIKFVKESEDLECV